MQFVAYLWCSSCARDPRTSQVHVWMMHIFRGRSATTWPFETNPCVWVTWCSLKGALKGKGELGPCKDFHCTPVLVYSPPSSFLCSYCLLLLIDNFWWGNGVKGPIMIPFWCLMPKGEKLRPKQQMDQLPLEYFENNRVGTFDLSKYSYCQNLVSCGENLWLWEKGKVFGSWSFSLLDYLSWCPNKWVWIRNRKMNLICKNKPSGSKDWSKYVKICGKTILFSIALLLHFFGCFWMCWHKSPKRGRLKGKCALGPFL
jgi:hypothetical protein